MHFPDSSHPPVEYSGSEAGNLKQTAQEIPADGAFVLTLMGSLSRTLDQGLLLSVVVETPNERLAVTVSTLLLAVLQ